jgi:hypothetical protein
MKLKIFFSQFPNPWALRVSGMGGYTSKCEKKSKSLHPNVQYAFSAKLHSGICVAAGGRGGGVLVNAL